MIKEVFSAHLNTTITISIVEKEVYFFAHDNIIYDFSFDEWPESKRQLQDKKWFTQEMADFLTSNIQPC